MKTRTIFLSGILSCILASTVHAGEGPAQDKPLLNLEDAKTLQTWKIDAWTGDATKQERLADLLLDPGAHVKKADRLEGVHFLVRAATSGKPKAMRQLADALDKGAHGFKKLPAAATCWSGMPADFEARLACLRLTDLVNPRDRVRCNDLTEMREGLPPGRVNPNTMARLCLANKTPAVLVPGPPPGKEDLERARLYGEHGIEWIITGDVYDEEYEKYRYEFNRTIAEAIMAERGSGYLNKLSDDIEARIATWRQRGK